MKFAFQFALLSALCNAAIGLGDGHYLIGSKAFPSQVLSQTSKDPLHFALHTKNVTQKEIWNVAKSEKQDYYSITSYHNGEFINSDPLLGSTCHLGQQFQQYIAEFQGDNNYQLVQNGSGYFLRAADDGILELAEYDTSNNELFTFIALRTCPGW
ncbi:hypothetical protein N7468_004006 [Penicillium chermesinum]|uniref:Uncharacterized protein n=1 Tax=Penicillium chermesinum TaxID=63820 RepID=A0A9W9P7U3_9EURO|nr:uncharacterized protein N7468_004006 [Penicillium chermesinum]KAJ5239387.1 hypothetical protein N7468_004006 [Penicillium chermesinum]KAJ6165008.1 hypothetical protein N7470_003680 [Penicillium chermesinum]